METGIIVAIIAAIAAIIGGIVSGVFSIVLQKSKHKDEKEDMQSDWQKETDERLDSVEESLNELEGTVNDFKDVGKLMLKGLMLLTRHAVDHNGNNDLEAYADEVSNVLIERL